MPFAASKDSSNQRQALEALAQDVIKVGQGKSASDFFKMINDGKGEIAAVVAKMGAQKARLTSYDMSSDTIPAASDPSLVGKKVSDFKAVDGKSIRDLAAEKLASPEAKNGVVTFTLHVSYDSKQRVIVAFDGGNLSPAQKGKTLYTVAATAAE